MTMIAMIIETFISLSTFPSFLPAPWKLNGTRKSIKRRNSRFYVVFMNGWRCGTRRFSGVIEKSDLWTNFSRKMRCAALASNPLSIVVKSFSIATSSGSTPKKRTLSNDVRMLIWISCCREGEWMAVLGISWGVKELTVQSLSPT